MIHRIFQKLFQLLTFSIDSLEPGETCTATMSLRHSAGDNSRCLDMEWWVLIPLYPNSSYWLNLNMSCKMIKKNMIPVIFFFNLCIPVVINSFTLKLWISNEIVSFTESFLMGIHQWTEILIGFICTLETGFNWSTYWVDMNWSMYMYVCLTEWFRRCQWCVGGGGGGVTPRDGHPDS